MVLLANFFFLDKIEPDELSNFNDKFLSLLLFQFDYLLLFVYLLFKSFRFPNPALFFLSFVYGVLFAMGMSSLLITNSEVFDIFYAYLQPILRLVIVGVFLGIGFNKLRGISTFTKTLIFLGVGLGGYFLYVLNKHPRPNMLPFNFYWVVIMAFFMFGVLVKIKNSGVLFSLGVLFIFLSDLYYILPPQVRLFEMTYIFIRLINSTGELILVKYLLEHYMETKNK